MIGKKAARISIRVDVEERNEGGSLSSSLFSSCCDSFITCTTLVKCRRSDYRGSCEPLSTRMFLYDGILIPFLPFYFFFPRDCIIVHVITRDHIRVSVDAIQVVKGIRGNRNILTLKDSRIAVYSCT